MSDTPTTGVAQATPDGELRRQILSQCVAKNEREWWAAGRIEKLEFELNAANERIKRLVEAGDALFELCDASPIQFELVDQIPQRLKAWEEAKEDKP